MAGWQVLGYATGRAMRDLHAPACKHAWRKSQTKTICCYVLAAAVNRDAVIKRCARRACAGQTSADIASRVHLPIGHVNSSRPAGDRKYAIEKKLSSSTLLPAAAVPMASVNSSEIGFVIKTFGRKNSPTLVQLCFSRSVSSNYT